MRTDIHPDYHEITVIMTDGTEYKTRSTYGKEGDVLKLDVDSASHPAWQGGAVRVIEKGQLTKFESRYGSLFAEEDNAPAPAPEQEEKEDAPAEEAPAEETPAEETPAEEAPAEETPAEETPAEETPAEETPTEEAPAEEAPAEETPAEEAPAEDTESPAEEKSE